MSRRWTIILITVVALLLYVIMSGMWDPRRWDMYYMAWQDTVPVSFYGKVVDMHGQPITGAKVEMKLFTRNPLYIFGADTSLSDVHYKAETDQNGRFKLEGVRGSMLIIENVTKTAYQFEPPIAGGGYWDTVYYYAGPGTPPPHRPDSAHPIQFVMETAAKENAQ